MKSAKCDPGEDYEQKDVASFVREWHRLHFFFNSFAELSEYSIDNLVFPILRDQQKKERKVPICVSRALCMHNSIYSSQENELVIRLHALALGKHPLLIIKAQTDSSKPWAQTSASPPPGSRRMLKAVGTNWFPCLLFVMGTTRQSTPSINSSGIGERKQQGGCLVSRQIDLTVGRALVKTDVAH